MSRNESRAGAMPDLSPAASSEQQSSPTEFVSLPSGGRFYPEGHPLFQVEEIEIKYMSSKEEDMLASPSLINKGIVIDRMLESVILNKKIKIDDILLGDKNALIVAARITGFGENYTVTATCPKCGDVRERNFDLSKITQKELALEEISEDGTVQIELPISKATITCKMLTGRDEKYLTTMAENKKKNKLPETPVTDQMKQFIVAVNGDKDKVTVARFVDSMLLRDSKFLKREYRKAIPDIVMAQEMSCEVCRSESEVDIPLGVGFFWDK